MSLFLVGGGSGLLLTRREYVFKGALLKIEVSGDAGGVFER